jgi:hypothetical protein
MSELRERLERESERVTLDPGADVRLWDRRRRLERRRRTSALAVGAATALVVVVASVQGLRVTGDGRSPAPPGSTAGYDEIAGSYSTELPVDLRVEGLRLGGRYELRLLPSGSLLLSVPPDFEQAVGSVVFRLSGNIFTTNAFANYSCPGTVGTYRWFLDGDVLRFVPLEEPCELRGAVFSTRPWRIGTSG